MAIINLPQDQQRAISAVDMRAFESAIDRCLMGKRVSLLYGFGLRECGKHVRSMLGTFERAMTEYNSANAFCKERANLGRCVARRSRSCPCSNGDEGAS